MDFDTRQLKDQKHEEVCVADNTTAALSFHGRRVLVVGPDITFRLCRLPP